MADAMLGSLARWLRVLGVDVSYEPSLDDAELVQTAREQRRIILTRDTHLVKRRLARRHILIQAVTLPEQLREVCLALGIRPDRERLFGRCLRCNRLLEVITPAAAAMKVPPHVARTQQEFRECPECRRIYWRATHVEEMLRRLRSLGLSPGNGAEEETRTPTGEKPTRS